MQRTAIFIDGAHLAKVIAKHHQRARIDYQKLVRELTGKADLLRAYYYDAPPWQSQVPTPEERERFSRKQAFFHALSMLPRFEVREGRCARYWNPDKQRWDFEQKRVDALCSVDLVRLASKAQIQRAVLVAGDSDFLPAVKVAKDEGVLLELWHSPDLRDVHRDLVSTCDDRYPIDSALIERILK